MSPLKTLICAIALVLVSAVWVYAIPPLMNYQGILLDASSNPVTVTTSVQFTIFNELISGDALWSETQSVTPDASGLFNVLLGSISPIPDAVFDGEVYLNIIVGVDPPLTPRQRIVSVGYSYRVSSIDGSLGGSVIGDVDISGKATIGANHSNTSIGGFVAGVENNASGSQSTVAGGNFNSAAGSQATVGGGFSNFATADHATIGGGNANLASDVGATVGGGSGNNVSNSYATIGGGQNNAASGSKASVGGGVGNDAIGSISAIAGGYVNVASGGKASVLGGESNDATGDWSTVGGGQDNTASGSISTVGGGRDIVASGTGSAVAGGIDNVASGLTASVLGGAANDAIGDRAAIGGGYSNRADAEAATVGGGRNNRARGAYSVIAGGGGDVAIDSNSATGLYSAVGGGRGIVAGGDGSTVGGGLLNVADGFWATIGGGEGNVAAGLRSTISGGQSNAASGVRASIGGGQLHAASGNESTIGGGTINVASGWLSTVSGGYSNEASGGYSTVSGGFDNEASGDYAFAAGRSNSVAGDHAVGIGRENVATANNSVALGNDCSTFGLSSLAAGEQSATSFNANYAVAFGRRAFAGQPGQFVFADSTDAIFSVAGANAFAVRASGGVGLGTASPSGRALVVDNAFTGADDVLLDLNASVDVTVSGRDILQIEVNGSATDIQYIECERGSDVEFRVHGNGDVTADGAFTGGGADFAELVQVSSGYHSVSAGDVMVIDTDNPHSVIKSTGSKSTLVAGIFSTRPGYMASPHDWDEIASLKAGVTVSASDNGELTGRPVLELAAEMNEVPLAVVGIVPCRVSAENGPIRTGDLLVTSATPGHAMRDDNPRAGTIVGKALAPLAEGTGLIKVLVTLQ